MSLINLKLYKDSEKYYDLNNSKVMIEYEGNDYKYTVNLIDKQ